MPDSEILIRLTYQNGGHFRMTSKGGNGDEVLTVCHIQENGNIRDAWPDVEKICDSYFKLKLREIGDEMKKPTPPPPPPEGG